MLYFLRATLADRPGSLASVARAISRTGGDIVQVHALERGDGLAVDDFLVHLPGHCEPDALLASIADVIGVQVDALRPVPAEARWWPDLDLLGELARSPHRALNSLVVMAPDVFRAGSAWALARDENGRAVVLHATPAAPVLGGTNLPWLPMRVAGCVAPGAYGCTEFAEGQLAAAPVGCPDTVVVVARPGGPSFRPVEVLHLARLCEVTAALMAAAAPPR
jgi:hypothetical protein